MAHQLIFDFPLPADLAADKVARVQAAIKKYRDRAAPRSDEDITGREDDVLGVARRRWIDGPQRKVEANTRSKAQARLERSRFHLPRPPVGRPRTEDGRQSFHFELTTVTKGVDGICRTDDKDGADPVEHVAYVMREEAVVAEPDAVSHLDYVKREAAVAVDSDGQYVMETNIPGDAADFFRTVLEHERGGHPDGICFAEPLDVDALQRMAADETIPQALKEAIEQVIAAPAAYRVAGSGNKWTRSHPFQLDADISGCQTWLKENDPGQMIHLREGRGGIVQRRITGELPSELSVPGCARVLSALGHELDRRGLRYLAVLHEPTAANHERNWHFHLLYHDRPCELIDGQWDFAIVKEHKSASRNRRQTHPFRQNKHKDVRAKEWPGYLRKLFADAVNAELAQTSSKCRYDPRTYEAMGIAAEPQDHLGRKKAFLAACGAAPAAEQENARKGWAWVWHQLQRRHERTEADDAAKIALLRAIRPQDEEAQRELNTLDQRLKESRANTHTGEFLLGILHSMAKSNAESTARDMKGRAAARAEKRRAKGKDVSNDRYYRAFTEREAEAHTYANQLQWDFKPEVDLASALIADANFVRVDVELDFQFLQKRLEKTTTTPVAAMPAAAVATVAPAQPQAARPAAIEHTRVMPASQPSAAEVDEWIMQIQKQRRRLTRRNGRVEPFNLDQRDQQMLASASPRQLKEVDLLRDQQNRLISRIVEAVEKTPGMLIIPPDPAQRWTLTTADPTFQDGLRCYQDDPAVQERLRTAQQAGRARIAAQRSPASNFHRVVDEISRAGMPVHKEDERWTISRDDAAKLRITPTELQDPTIQRRLAGIHGMQEKLQRSPAPPATVAPVAPAPAAVSPRTQGVAAPNASLPPPRITVPAESANVAGQQAAAPSVISPLPDQAKLAPDASALPPPIIAPLETPRTQWPQSADPLAISLGLDQGTSMPVGPVPPPSIVVPVEPAKVEEPRPAEMLAMAPSPHPLVESWQQAVKRMSEPGSAITAVERNRRAALIIADAAAVEDLGKRGAADLAAARSQAADNAKRLQNMGRQTGRGPHIS